MSRSIDRPSGWKRTSNRKSYTPTDRTTKAPGPNQRRYKSASDVYVIKVDPETGEETKVSKAPAYTRAELAEINKKARAKRMGRNR